MRRLPKLMILGGVFLLGAIAGPVGVAAVRGLSAPRDGFGRRAVAAQLLQAFDERRAELPPMASLDFGGLARDCGYDSDVLFAADDEGRLEPDAPWSPSGGYFDLMLWYERLFPQQVSRLRTAHLVQSLTPFQIGFLNACLRRTIFATWCAALVERRLEAADLLSRYFSPVESGKAEKTRRLRTIYTYLEGVAAKVGESKTIR